MPDTDLDTYSVHSCSAHTHKHTQNTILGLGNEHKWCRLLSALQVLKSSPDLRIVGVLYDCSLQTIFIGNWQGISLYRSARYSCWILAKRPVGKDCRSLSTQALSTQGTARILENSTPCKKACCVIFFAKRTEMLWQMRL